MYAMEHGLYALYMIYATLFDVYDAWLQQEKFLLDGPLIGLSAVADAWVIAKAFMEWVYAWASMDESVGCGGANCTFD